MKKIILPLVILFYLFSNTSGKEQSNGLLFDGYNSYVDCSYDSLLRSSSMMSLSLWVNTSKLDEWQALVWCGSYYENHYAFKITPDNKFRGLIWIDGPITLFSQSTVQRNEWYHIAFTFDNSLTEDNFKLYVNGILEDKKTITGFIGEDTNDLIMGVYPGLMDQYFEGWLKGVQVWNRALSQEEIQQKMNNSLNPANENGLVAYWPMNEGEGDILHDISGNNIHGFIYNAYWENASFIKARITTSSVWLDSDYSGTETKLVSAENSSGEITSYTWLVESDTVASGANPTIELSTGTHWLTLIVNDSIGNTNKDSMMISVYSSKLETDGSIYSAPSQLNKDLFLISSLDDKVYCFDSTGAVKWNYLTGGDIQSTIAVGDTNNIFVTSSDTRLYSLNSLGIPNWDKAMGGIAVTSPTVVDIEKTLYFGMTNGRLFSMSYDNKVNWSIQTEGSIVSSAVIGNNGTIYFGSTDKNLYAISPNKVLLWKYLTSDSIISSPALAFDSSVVFGSSDGYIYKVSKSGDLIWKFNTEGVIYSAPVIDEDGNIYIGSMSGFFYALSNDGNLLWKYDTNAGIRSTASLSLDGTVIYFGCDNGNIYSLSKTGTLKWLFLTGAPVQAPTLVTNCNIVYAGNTNGDLYILKDNLNMDFSNIAEMQWPTFQGNNQRTGVVKNYTVTSVDEVDNKITDFSLSKNYPNPFNPTTTISYSLPAASLVEIKIYNLLGEVIHNYKTEIKQPGKYQVKWNANSNPSGVYFFEINATQLNNGKAFHSVNKMLLIK